MPILSKPRLRRAIYTKNQFEKAAWAQNALICGIDEVGRGCLAGPLIAAAVILPINARHRLIRDSKTLNEQQRKEAYYWLIKHCWFGIGIVHNRIIDQHNIWQATLLAMKRALVHATTSCPIAPESIVIDAMPLTADDVGWKNIPIYHFPKGEDISSSIAAASIIAKVTRDHMMQRMNRIVPGYYLDEHKGYATKKHLEVLHQRGHSIIHRTTFLSTTAVDSEGKKDEKQRSLC